MSTIRRLSAACAALVVVTSASLVLATPAQAMEGCHGNESDSVSNSKTIALPGKPDVNLVVNLCLYDETGFYQGVSIVNWGSSVGGTAFGNRFNYFYSVVWVQKNDVNKCSNTAYPDINGSDGGSLLHSCSWDAANTSGVSVDGKIVYDVANDGKGAYTWQLTGT
ncbi:hypothetical protein AB0L70_07015 [Kribbella sp. NPDC051952]|uniref:hypothetical protein n=1 Tax=Kribbella sp. NPDC051952 TaxID=3154851 RepID=UPI00343B1852